MLVEIKIPAMGESVSEATISRVICENGSIVQRDQQILEIETDKVNQVLYASHSGQLQLKVSVGQIVRIGDVIGSIDTSVAKEVQTPLPVVKAVPTELEQPKTPAQPQPLSAPAVRISVQDSLTSKPSATPPSTPTKSPMSASSAPLNSVRKRMSSLRKTIATRLVEVKNTTAMLTSFNEVNMEKIIEIRSFEKEAFQTKYGVKLGFMSFFVKAVVAALQAFPDIHSYIEADDIVQFPNYDIGVAVSTDKGLMVPVIRGCDKASFGEIEKQIELYAKKAREGSLSIEDLKGGCFTITNGGVFGSLLSTPILNPPQSGILGMHSIVKRAVVEADQIVIRPMMYLALSYDHRIIDGKEAVQFLVHIKQNLEDPSRLLLEL